MLPRFHGPGHRRGSATIEAAVAFPLLIFLLLAGLMIGYYLYVKLTLSWWVYQEAHGYALRTPTTASVGSGRDLLLGEQHPLNLPQAQGFTLSVHLKIVPKPFVVSFACYKMPLSIPWGAVGGSQVASNDAARQAGSRLDRILHAADRLASGLDKDLAQLQAFVDDANLAAQLARQFIADRPEARQNAVRLVGGWLIESGMERLLCGNGWTVSARTVMWREQTVDLH